MSKKSLRIIFLCGLSLVLLFAIPASAQELEYQPLEPFPNVDQSGTGQSLESVLNFAFQTLFTIGGLIAVFAFIIGGIAYMTSEVAHKKDEAKKRIQAAIYGLLLLAVSWLILNTINPDLLKFNFNPTTLNSNNSAAQGTGNAPGPLRITIDRAESVKIYNSDSPDDVADALESYNRTQCNNRGVRAVEGGSDNHGAYTLYQCIQ